jgi:hypothetical protein
MIITRWIIHCDECGYLLRQEYPTEWASEKERAYQFRHKREAAGAIEAYSQPVREHLRVEPCCKRRADVIFD